MDAQFTVPLVHCAAWCPSLPQMLQAWMELPAGRRSLWCLSMVAAVARVAWWILITKRTLRLTCTSNLAIRKNETATKKLCCRQPETHATARGF